MTGQRAHPCGLRPVPDHSSCFSAFRPLKSQVRPSSISSYIQVIFTITLRPSALTLAVPYTAASARDTAFIGLHHSTVSSYAAFPMRLVRGCLLSVHAWSRKGGDASIWGKAARGRNLCVVGAPTCAIALLSLWFSVEVAHPICSLP